MNRSYVVGIDEVGRGALAGPVFVCAAAIPVGLRIRNNELGVMKDSKKVSPSKREKWFEVFSAGGACLSGRQGSSSGGKNNPQIKFAIAKIYPRGIEKMNISRAANLAALRAFTRLSKTYNLKPKTCSVFLDGGLYLGNRKDKKSPHHESVKNQRESATAVVKTVVKGDEKITAIKIASIIAKVSRDRAITLLAKKYPGYGLEIHKGYGTRRHLAAIKKFGPSEIHRRTFIKFT